MLFSPTNPSADFILHDLASGHVSLHDVATSHDTTVDALSLWLSTPEISARRVARVLNVGCHWSPPYLTLFPLTAYRGAPVLRNLPALKDLLRRSPPRSPSRRYLPRMPPPGPQSWYQSLLRDTLAPALKLRGFKRSASNFGLRGSGVWGVISFWRDSWNDRDHVEFSITLNLFSDVIYRELHEGPPLDLTRVPSSAYWHYHREFPGDIEIGPLRHLRREGMDTLCLIRWRTDMSSVSDEILRVVLNHAVPWIREHRTDRDLMKLPAPSPPGEACGGDLQLAALLHEYGPLARFERVAVKLLRDSTGPFRKKVRRKLEQWGAKCVQ